MIRKVCQVDPMLCPECGGSMKVIAFITDYAAVDRIIDHLKLTFVAAKPPSPRIAFLIYNFAVASTKNWFLWLSVVILFVLNLLFFIFKPKPKAA